MDWITAVLVPFFMLLCAAGLILVVLQLPGGWIVLGGAIVIEVTDQWYRSPESTVTFGWTIIGLAVVLLSFGELMEFLAGMVGAAKGGASKAGMWCSLIGGILGAIVLTPVLVFIPVIGTLIGAIVGTFVGAIVGEVSIHQRTMRESMRPAIGATIGRILGTVAKVGTTVAACMVLIIAMIWPAAT